MGRKYRIVSCEEESGYRYRLDVETGESGNIAAVVQLNPSKASASRSDPTIGKVSRWAGVNQVRRVIFLNLFAIRGTDPRSLIGRSYSDLVGPRNDVVSAAVFQQAHTIILAWGDIRKNLHEHYHRRLKELQALIGGSAIHGVGAATAAEFPRHGRMWNSNNRTIRTLSWSTLIGLDFNSERTSKA